MMMAKGFDGRSGLAVGDVVAGASGRAALFRPGPVRWHALRVAPQREVFVERWLALRDVLSFHPVKTSVVVRHGLLRRNVRRYLPGYVFARFPGEALMHRVTACAFVTGALHFHSSGDWACIQPDDLRDLYDMRNVDAALEDASAAEAARRKALRAVRAGGMALFACGPLEGVACEVVELTGSGHARVKLHLFGAEHLASVRAVDLVSDPKTD